MREAAVRLGAFLVLGKLGRIHSPLGTLSNVQKTRGQEVKVLKSIRVGPGSRRMQTLRNDHSVALCAVHVVGGRRPVTLP